MGNKRWTRVLALVMALVCTLTVVAAVEFDALDVNKDGKVTVWDLQAWLNEDAEKYNAALKQVLGGKGDELNPVRYEGENDVPVYEIWSEMGLKNMAKNAKAGYIFELKTDIDLGGKNWTPIDDFKGIFRGNDNTISNFKITKSINKEMGFFADTQNASNEDPGRTKITDLHLRGVEIIADSNAQFIGAITGTNRGDIENCTTVSEVTDLRLGKSVYYGTIAGRNTENSDKTATVGRISGANELETTVNITTASSFDDAVITKDEYQGSKTVNSKMAVHLSEDLTFEEKKSKRYMGIAGFTRTDAIDQDLRWQDITNSTKLAASELQSRRDTVANEMYYLCTVEWQPNEKMVLWKTNDEGTDWKSETTILGVQEVAVDPGTGYPKQTCTHEVLQKGLPYSHGSTGRDTFDNYVGYYTGEKGFWEPNSYYFNSQNRADYANDLWREYKSLTETADQEEFLAKNPIAQLINARNDLNNKKVNDQYTPVGYSTNGSYRANDQLGWSMYLGADCSSQAAWAWRKVSAVASTTGFANVQGTNELYPSEGTEVNGTTTGNYINSYGILAVNNLKFDYAGDANSDDRNDQTGDKAVVVENYYKENKEHFMESLAMTSMGDLLIGYTQNGGHTQMALSDAVVIYSFDSSKNNYAHSSLDPKLSYIVTAEQGGDPNKTDSDGIHHYYEKTTSTHTATAYWGTTKNYECEHYAWKSTCCVDRRSTFADLVNDGDGLGKMGYIFYPITCDALRNADSEAVNAYVEMTYNTEKEIWQVTSNFQITSTTTIKEDGTPRTVYTTTTSSGHRAAKTAVNVQDWHGKIAENTEITVRLANGKDYKVYYQQAQKVTTPCN